MSCKLCRNMSLQYILWRNLLSICSSIFILIILCYLYLCFIISAQQCSDPGTPGGARQMASSYEIGSKVTFECLQEGYAPSPASSIVCMYDSVQGQPVWSDTIPVCKGK